MSLRLLTACASLAALAIATPAAAKDAYLFAKPGVGRAELQAQGAQCWEEARGVKPPNPSYAPVYTPNAYAAAGAGLAIGIMQGIAQAKAQNAYVEACMRDHGFGKVPLTPDEAAALDAAKGRDAQNAVYDAFLAKDLAARVAAALTPAAAPMAPAAPEAYAVGGLKLDPAKVVVSENGVLAKQPLLTATASHRRTAVLKQDFRVTGVLDTRAEAGAVFHQVSYAARPKGALSGDTQWCGPVANNSIRGRISGPSCIWASFDGYQVAAPYGAKAWLKGDGATLQPVVVKGSELVLEESDQDLLGPMDVSLNVAKLTKAGAMLEAVAVKDGQKVEVWSGFVKLEDGAGELPFWDKRLKITRIGDSLHAVLTPDGDGRGWLDTSPAG